MWGYGRGYPPPPAPSYPQQSSWPSDIDQRPPLPPGPGPILPSDPPPPSPPPSNSDSMDPSNMSRPSVNIPPTLCSSFDSFAHHHPSKTMDIEDDPFVYRGRNNQSGVVSGGDTSRGRQTAFVSPVRDPRKRPPPSTINDEDTHLYGSNSGDPSGLSGGCGVGNVAFAPRRKPGGSGGGNRNFTEDDYQYGDRGFQDFDYRSPGKSDCQSGGGVFDDLGGDFDGRHGTSHQQQDRDLTDDIFLPKGRRQRKRERKRQRREDSPSRGFGGGRGFPRDYDRSSQPPDPIPFDKNQYPQKGSLKIANESKLAKCKPAVHELPKIQKKQRTPEEENASQSEKLAQLRMEHAKLEMTIGQLQTLIDRTITKENEIKKNFKGQSLAKNIEFVDNMKFRSDVQRRLDEMKKDYEFKDTIIKKMMEPKVGRRQRQEEEQGSSQVAPGVTDFLSQREEVLEETDDKYEFFDGGEHWCQSCNFFGENVKELLKHLQTEGHWTTISSTKRRVPWPIIRRNPSKAPDRSLVAIKGSQFMIPCKGYYCAICRTFCGDIESGEEHLYSLMHNKAMIKFGITKPEYEFIFNKDKIAAKNKAEADRRKKERDIIEQRNREAEEKKRIEEEERKRHEREIREKARQDNLQRLKELENKRKEKERARERDRDRDRHRKNKKKAHISDSPTSSCDDSNIAVVSRPSGGVAVTAKKEPPENDPKIKAGCTVGISYIEARRTRKALEKAGMKVTYLGKVLALVGNSIENQKWVTQKPMNKKLRKEAFGSATSPTASSPSAVCSSSKQSQKKCSSFEIPQPKIVVEFDDDSNDEFNLTSVTEEKSNDPSDIKDSSTEENAEGNKEDSNESSTTDISNEKDKVDRNSQISDGEDTITDDEIFSAINEIISTEGTGEETPMETDASADKTPKTTSTTTTDLTSTTTSYSLSPTKKIEPPTADDDMSSPLKITSISKSILPLSIINVDSPTTTLDLDVLTKSPTCDEEDNQ